MAVRFHPLPVDLFSREQAPHIARLNSELSDLFGLEGTIRQPLIVSRSDSSIVRRATEQVHITRITPAIASVVSGASSVIGTPAVTLGLLNTVGTTNTVISVDSAIKIFDTTNPADIATSASVGTAAVSARRDHVHNHPALGGDLHTSYILASGTRAFTGNQSMGGFDLTTIGDLTNDADDTINIISDKADGSNAQAVRVIANLGAAPSGANDFQYLAVGYDGGSGFVDQVLLYRTDAFGPGVGVTDTGTFKGFVGYPGSSGRTTGFVMQESVLRIRANNNNSFDITDSTWNVLNAAQFGFKNNKSGSGGDSIFAFFPSTTKTSGEFISFENPVNTNIWECDFAGAVIQAKGLTTGGNNNFQAFYTDVGEIAVPSNPGANIRRLFVDSSNGEISVRTNAGSTVSLEGAGGGSGDSFLEWAGL